VSAAWLAPVAGSRTDRRSPRRWGTIVAIALIPLIAPRLLFPAAGLLAFQLTDDFRSRSGAEWSRAAAVCAGLAIAAIWLTVPSSAIPAGTTALRVAAGCVAPSPWNGDLAEARAQAGVAAAAVGALPFGLALVGAFVHVYRTTRRTWMAAVFVLACVFWNGPIVTDAAFVPVLVGFWTLAAVGLAEAIDSVPSRHRLGAVALAALVPLLAWQRLSFREPPQPLSAYGHEGMSAEQIRRIAEAVNGSTSSEGSLVEEDASVALLLRAARVLRNDRGLRLVRRDPAAIEQALGRVFALPLAQRSMQLRGVRFAAPGISGVPGLAEVVSVSRCAAINRWWTELPALTETTALALAAGSEQARGPVIVYAGAGQPFQPGAPGWPPAAMRGFQVREYRRAERPDLSDALLAQGVPSSSGTIGAPFVLRLELWRTPHAPRALGVALGIRPHTTVARADPSSTPPFPEVCPWFAFEVRRIGE
jgi:hypothetical protein